MGISGPEGVLMLPKGPDLQPTALGRHQNSLRARNPHDPKDWGVIITFLPRRGNQVMNLGICENSAIPVYIMIALLAPLAWPAQVLPALAWSALREPSWSWWPYHRFNAVLCLLSKLAQLYNYVFYHPHTTASISGNCRTISAEILGDDSSILGLPNVRISLDYDEVCGRSRQKCAKKGRKKHVWLAIHSGFYLGPSWTVLADILWDNRTISGLPCVQILLTMSKYAGAAA